MRLSQDIMEALTTENANRPAVAVRTVENYIRQTYGDILEVVETGHGQVLKAKEIKAGAYGARIEIVSSGNEPKLYAHIMDNNGESIYYCRIFDTTPNGYGKLAQAAGAFMEVYNLYLYYNNL